MSTEALQREETITKPPTRWKNRWHAKTDVRNWCVRCGKSVLRRAGETWETHCYVYPSKDTAMTQAEELRAQHRRITYLGAFPVEEAP